MVQDIFQYADDVSFLLTIRKEMLQVLTFCPRWDVWDECSFQMLYCIGCNLLTI